LSRTPNEDEDLALAEELRQTFKLDNYTPRMVLDYIRQVFSVNTVPVINIKIEDYVPQASYCAQCCGSGSRIQ
jgi:hypothetical protein